MGNVLLKLSIVIILMCVFSGYDLELTVFDNLIRTSAIYLIFSVLILLILLLFNQSSHSMLKAQMEQEPDSEADSMSLNSNE